MKFWSRVSFLLVFSTFAWNTFAIEIFFMDEEHSGVVQSGDYQIFPEKRRGNALYRENQLLVSFPNRQILEVMQVPDAKSIVYLYADFEDELAMGIYDLSQQERARIKRVDDEFYEVWVPALGVRKIFRIYKNRLESVASRLRTATGVTPSNSHVAYYHILSSEIIQVDGVDQRAYDFRIHILNRDADKGKILSQTVYDTRPVLSLSWVDGRTLRYQLSDGTTQDIDVAAQLPGYF